jgi:hypothetical protein
MYRSTTRKCGQIHKLDLSTTARNGDPSTTGHVDIGGAAMRAVEHIPKVWTESGEESLRYHPWRRSWRMMGNHLVLPGPTGARNHLVLLGPTGVLLLLRHLALCPPSDSGRWWPRCTGKERLRRDRSSHCGSARPRHAAGTWLAVARL